MTKSALLYLKMEINKKPKKKRRAQVVWMGIPTNRKFGRVLVRLRMCISEQVYGYTKAEIEIYLAEQTNHVLRNI